MVRIIGWGKRICPSVILSAINPVRNWRLTAWVMSRPLVCISHPYLWLNTQGTAVYKTHRWVYSLIAVISGTHLSWSGPEVISNWRANKRFFNLYYVLHKNDFNDGCKYFFKDLTEHTTSGSYVEGSCYFSHLRNSLWSFLSCFQSAELKFIAAYAFKIQLNIIFVRKTFLKDFHTKMFHVFLVSQRILPFQVLSVIHWRHYINNLD